MDTSKVLYRGAREKVDVLTPQPLPEGDKARFPEGITSVVFASAYRQEALGYAIASRFGIGGPFIYPYWKDEINKEMGWKMELTCKSSDIPKEDKTYLYEVNSEGFVQNPDGEWYKTSEVRPTKVEEITVGDALKEFDEVKFLSDPEISVVSEGNGFRL